MAIEELLKQIHTYNAERMLESKSQAGKFRDRWLEASKEEDYVSLYNDIKEYLKTEPSNSERRIISGFSESIRMAYDWIQYEREQSKNIIPEPRVDVEGR